MKMKKQIIVIHGGDTFNNYQEYVKFLKDWKIDFKDMQTKRVDWKDNLANKLGVSFEVIAPRMPNKLNAKYLEWKIWFEKFLPHLNREVILLGHSLGGIFLVKYLSENILPKKISGLFLVAAPFDEKDSEYPLGSFKLKLNLSKISKQVRKIFIYQSKDDPVVPFADFGKYRKALPSAVFKMFENRRHFNQENFPELLKDIKSL